MVNQVLKPNRLSIKISYFSVELIDITHSLNQFMHSSESLSCLENSMIIPQVSITAKKSA